MIAICVACSANVILTANKEGFTITAVALAAQLFVISLYGLSFLLEMFANCYNKDEVEIVDAVSEDDYGYYSSGYGDTKTQDELVFSKKDKDRPESRRPSFDDIAFSNRSNDDDGEAIKVKKEDLKKDIDDGDIVFSNTKTPEEYDNADRH